MTAQDATDQLNEELLASIRTSLTSSPRRPLLHHLTADNSWLLQLPRPASLSSPQDNARRRRTSQASQKAGKHWYNIVIDPWLTGSHIDYFAWFSQQWHLTEPACPDIAAVDALINRVEALTARVSSQDREHEISDEDTSKSAIDVVFILHEFTDHCHRPTLSQIHPNVPVLATVKAASLISGWKHFNSVTEIPNFVPPGSSKDNDLDWRTRSLPPLPEWISVSRLTTPNDTGYLHSALMIAFNFNDDIYSQDEGAAAAEAIIHTPHGLPISSLEKIKEAKPPIRTLALLHGLTTVTITGLGTINLGAKNGLEVQRFLGAKYWMQTHDEEKKGAGLIGKLLGKRRWSVEDAVEMYQKEHANEEEPKPRFMTVQNGESVVLE